MRIKTTLLAACAVALIAPAVSQAATLGMDGNTLVYKGEGSEGNSGESEQGDERGFHGFDRRGRRGGSSNREDAKSWGGHDSSMPDQ